MKKVLKIILIGLGVLASIIVFDTLQAKIFDNSPLLKIRDDLNGDYIDKGLLVNHYYCNNEEVTVWKKTKFACPILKEVGLGYDEDEAHYWLQEKDIAFIHSLFKNYSFTTEVCDGIIDYYLFVDGNVYGIEAYTDEVHIIDIGKEIVLNELDSEKFIHIIEEWQEMGK